MAEFAPAIAFVLENEGGYVKDPVDPGGETNFGISKRFLLSLSSEKLRFYGFFNGIGQNSIKDMTHEQAIAIYFGEFWEAAPFFRIFDQKIANYVFDCCVNHGVATGVRILQRALWAAYRKINIVADDGVLGNKTLSAISSVSPYLLGCLMAERAGFYRSLKQPKFLKGWLDRAYRS